MTGRHLSAHDVAQRVAMCHAGDVVLDEATYVMTRTHARFIDVEFGEWWAQPHNVMNGSGHPERARRSNVTVLRANSSALAARPIARRRHVSLDAFKARFAVLGDVGFRFIDETFVNMATRATFVHEGFGEWHVSPRDFLRGPVHPTQRRLEARQRRLTPVTEVIARVSSAHGDKVTLDEASYAGVNVVARFIDARHGEWWAKPTNVMRGTSHPIEKQAKVTRSCLNASFVIHWKTCRELCAHGSYEAATLRWLNELTYDYDWQVPVVTPFLTPTGKRSTYYVDLYVKDGPHADTYVEIKGTWARKNGAVGRRKWEWFHGVHPNSVLWMKDDLIGLGILRR